MTNLKKYGKRFCLWNIHYGSRYAQCEVDPVKSGAALKTLLPLINKKKNAPNVLELPYMAKNTTIFYCTDNC